MSIPKYFPLIFCQLLTDAFGDVSVYKAESLPFRKLCGQGVSQKQEHPILFYFCHLSLGPGSDSAPAAREGGYIWAEGYVLGMFCIFSSILDSPRESRPVVGLVSLGVTGSLDMNPGNVRQLVCYVKRALPERYISVEESLSWLT